ncbi:MAG: FxsA family protein [Pseudomonadota bacterium]|nr:FxsA family protein [Pseudomonadota bacterium]MDP1903883.1 FxsA family protein [Pseudomonadota bacterium]MDP2353619.1 FxsA family protein [Pseudomonadota bacterium]
MNMRVTGGAAWLGLIIAVAIPALEIVGIYQIAQKIGWGWTLLWLIGAIWAGTTLIRAQHSDLPARVKQSLARGEAPFGEVWASGRRLLAGVLLILPGAGSDIIALLLLLWPTSRVASNIPPPPPPPPGTRREAGDIIEGEFRRED